MDNYKTYNIEEQNKQNNQTSCKPSLDNMVIMKQDDHEIKHNNHLE